MNQLVKIFNYEGAQVRTVLVDDELWFVGKDICEYFGDTNYRRSLSRLDDDEKGVSQINTPGGLQTMAVVNESGLYSLLFNMQPQKGNVSEDQYNQRFDQIKKFKRWITHEVLPSIRKHGAYMTPETLEAALLNPDTLIRLATSLKEEQDKRKVLEVANSALSVDNQIMKPKAEYFDELVDRNLLTSFRETAKQLVVKERDFIQFLLGHKYLYRDKKGKLMPYADKNNGLFEVKECFNEKTQWSGTQTLVTPKGRETFRLLYFGKG